MEPIATSLATAVISGAKAVFRHTASRTVKSAFRELINLLNQRYEGTVLDTLDPDVEPELDESELERQLTEHRVDEDDQAIELARRLLSALRRTPTIEEASAAIDLNRITAANINLNNIKSIGPAIKARNVKATGSLIITNLSAKPSGAPRPKKNR